MKPNHDVSVMSGYYCNGCGYLVLDVINNFDVETFRDWDYFCYCANKGCENHNGEGYFQSLPDFVSKFR